MPRALLGLGLTLVLTVGCLPSGGFPQILAPATTPTAVVPTRPPASPTVARTSTPAVSPTAQRTGTVTASGTITAARTGTPIGSGTPARSVTPAGSATPVRTGTAVATGTVRPAGSPTATGTVRAGAAVTSTSTAVRNTSNVNLRTADWSTIITQESALNHPQPPDSQPGMGPFVEFRTPGTIPGFADLQDIIYGDISGDGREEAIIPVVSGGTAGTVGYLIYFAGDREPVFATARTGYKLGARTNNGNLVVLEPIYSGWEANCCPSGISETRYRLVGSTLDRLSRDENGIPETIPLTVERFYQLINEKQLRDAYAFLSPEYQAANPFDRWAEGFASTAEVQAEAALVPGQNAATVTITSTERTASGQSTRRFNGRWNVIWSSPARQWLLNQAQINEVR